MTTTDQQKKNDRLFILVSANFIMLFVLFCGMGYAIWQSTALVKQLKGDLQRAENSIAKLNERIHGIDGDVLAERLMANVAGRVKTSVSNAIGQTSFGGSLQDLSEKVEKSREGIERTEEAIQEISEKVQHLDSEQLAQLVAYHLLKGLGEGFSQAAEARKP